MSSYHDKQESQFADMKAEIAGYGLTAEQERDWLYDAKTREMFEGNISEYGEFCSLQNWYKSE